MLLTWSYVQLINNNWYTFLLPNAYSTSYLPISSIGAWLDMDASSRYLYTVKEDLSTLKLRSGYTNSNASGWNKYNGWIFTIGY